MTKQQKEIFNLKKEIKKLKRDNFILKEKVKDLEKVNARSALEKVRLEEEIESLNEDASGEDL